MKKTDPANLRVPALKLLAELLPAGSTAGVWLFDQGVNVLLPPSTVDAAWKKNARARATGIHSRGLFTNIEAALAAASADWKAGPMPSGTERHVVLLTDGVVDVAKDPALSAASRGRVLGEMLAQLRQKSVHVHTVALSKDVDGPLLEALASGTGGWREEAPTAAALQRAFLHMFEQAAAPDTVPLKGNSFSVDASVKELTLLVFRKPGAEPLCLTGPDRISLSAEAPGAHSRWQHEDGYDLVTIEAPVAGEWHFNAAEDPDNRALIVTDLALKLGQLPVSALPGLPVTVRAQLLEREHPIEREDFLALARTTVVLRSEDGAGDIVDLPLDPATHAFSGVLGTVLPAGAYELTVNTQSATFEREIRRRLRIENAPITVTATAKPAKGKDAAGISVRIEVNNHLVRPATLSGYVLATDPANGRDAHELPAFTKGSGELTIPAKLGGKYTIAPTFVFESRTGGSLRLQPAPLTVAVDGPPQIAEPAAAAPAPPPPVMSYGRIAGIVGVGNLGLGSVLGPVWFFLRRRGLPTKGVSL